MDIKWESPSTAPLPAPVNQLYKHCYILPYNYNSPLASQTALHYKIPSNMTDKKAPATMHEMDERSMPAWVLSFSAAMVPFCAFCYGHSRGVTTRVVERVVKSPVGVYGLLALPFLTLGMEKSIYDTVQSWQGLDPNVVPKDRGGFPSGGSSLPSFSLIPVRKIAKRLTQAIDQKEQQEEK